jgi:hypothetical protein
MAQRKKAKPKRKSPSATKGKDEKQSARFIEMARMLEADESGGPFEHVFSRIVPEKKRR